MHIHSTSVKVYTVLLSMLNVFVPEVEGIFLPRSNFHFPHTYSLTEAIVLPSAILWNVHYSLALKGAFISYFADIYFSLHHSHRDELAFFSSYAGKFFSKTAPSANPLKRKIHPRQLSCKMKRLWQEFVSPILLTAHMFAHRSPLQGLLKLSACLGVQVKERKRQTRTSQQMMGFNAGSESNPDPHPVCLTLIRVEARMHCINIHADVYLLSSSGRLSWTDCVSLALTHRCWQMGC